MPNAVTIPCVRCGAVINYRRQRGRKPKYCASCAPLVHAEQKSDRDKALRADQVVIRETAENLRPYLEPEMYARVEEYIQGLGVPATSRIPVGHDQMPPGSMSNGGSEDGVSTYYTDLAEDLEAHRMKVIMHDWFAENPRWSDGLTGA